MLKSEQLHFFGPESNLTKVEANTDGGNYLSNPGPGGIGIVFRLTRNGKRYIKKIHQFFPQFVPIEGENLRLAQLNKKKKPVEKDGVYFVETTNNRCELQAIITAMQLVKQPANVHLIIYSDSQWALNMAQGKWKANENKDLVLEARNLVSKFGKIEFKWVRGHSGDQFNEMCDELASKACKEQPEELIEELTVEEV